MSSRCSINFQAFASELLQNFGKCFLGTKWTAILSKDSIIQSHTGVVPASKGIILRIVNLKSYKKS